MVLKGIQDLVAATIRTVLAQPTTKLATRKWRQVVDGFRERRPKLAALLDDAESDVLAYRDFPPALLRQLWSTNPCERLNKERKRRSEVLGFFPHAAARRGAAGGAA